MKTMSVKRTVAAALVAAICAAAHAASWRGLDESSYISGPKVSAGDLDGKVVMVDEWGYRCPPCRALLPRMEQLWQSFRHKPFVLIGSHRQGREEASIKELIKDNKLTYPIYQGAGLSDGEPPNGGGIPFIYVVDHRGKVVYSGRDERAATEAAVTAMTNIDAPPSLTGNVTLKKYKAMEKQLALGKNIKSLVKKLEGDVKKAEGKSANAAQKEMAEEASAILSAIKDAKEDIKADIEILSRKDPPKALKLFMTTFPEDAAEYKEKLPELTAAAKEFAAKAKANGAKGAKK